MKPYIITTAILAITSLLLHAEAPTVSINAVSEKPTTGTIARTFTRRDTTIVINVESTPIITEKDIQTIQKGSTSPTAVRIVLSPEGVLKMNAIAKDMPGQQIAIIINERIVIAPRINVVSFGGRLELGHEILTADEAKALIDFYETKKG